MGRFGEGRDCMRGGQRGGGEGRAGVWRARDGGVPDSPKSALAPSRYRKQALCACQPQVPIMVLVLSLSSSLSSALSFLSRLSASRVLLPVRLFCRCCLSVRRALHKR